MNPKVQRIIRNLARGITNLGSARNQLLDLVVRQECTIDEACEGWNTTGPVVEPSAFRQEAKELQACFTAKV